MALEVADGCDRCFAVMQVPYRIHATVQRESARSTVQRESTCSTAPCGVHPLNRAAGVHPLKSAICSMDSSLGMVLRVLVTFVHGLRYELKAPRNPRASDIQLPALMVMALHVNRNGCAVRKNNPLICHGSSIRANIRLEAQLGLCRSFHWRSRLGVPSTQWVGVMRRAGSVELTKQDGECVEGRESADRNMQSWATQELGALDREGRDALESVLVRDAITGYRNDRCDRPNRPAHPAAAGEAASPIKLDLPHRGGGPAWRELQGQFPDPAGGRSTAQESPSIRIGS